MTVHGGDATLVAEMLGGGAPAFDGLFARHGASVRRVALAILHSPEAADDLVQEVFVFLWRHGDRYSRERGDLGAWLRTITRNRALDVLRAGGREAGMVATVRGHARTAASPPGPLDAALAAERASLLHAALAVLPPPQRQALTLAYGAGLSDHEVARATGVPLGTAKSRLRLGKQHMARHLEHEGLPEFPKAA